MQNVCATTTAPVGNGGPCEYECITVTNLVVPIINRAAVSFSAQTVQNASRSANNVFACGTMTRADAVDANIHTI